MDIKLKKTLKGTLFENIEIGSMFVYYADVYVKTKPATVYYEKEGNFNAILIGEDIHAIFTNDTEVIPVKEIIVNY